jgi:hypothetical protein
LFGIGYKTFLIILGRFAGRISERAGKCVHLGGEWCVGRGQL